MKKKLMKEFTVNFRITDNDSYRSNINIEINFALQNVAEGNHDKNRRSPTPHREVGLPIC